MMGIGGIGLILMLLFWGAIIVGGAWLVKTVFASGQTNQPGSKPAAPREILDRRYARGEISREEYEQMKADLA